MGCVVSVCVSVWVGGWVCSEHFKNQFGFNCAFQDSIQGWCPSVCNSTLENNVIGNLSRAGNRLEHEPLPWRSTFISDTSDRNERENDWCIP